MKSLLVDALRQKDDSQDSGSLSDSGSFATRRADLAATSTDDADSHEASSDLELMATGALIVANDEEPVFRSAGDGSSDDDSAGGELTETIAGETTRFVAGDVVVPVRDSLPSMPPVARYAPLACVALALLAGLTWFGIQQLELQQERSQLGSAAALRAGTTDGQNGIVATAPRFRYLSAEGQPLGDEAWQ